MATAPEVQPVHAQGPVIVPKKNSIQNPHELASLATAGAGGAGITNSGLRYGHGLVTTAAPAPLKAQAATPMMGVAGADATGTQSADAGAVTVPFTVVVPGNQVPQRGRLVMVDYEAPGVTKNDEGQVVTTLEGRGNGRAIRRRRTGRVSDDLKILNESLPGEGEAEEAEDAVGPHGTEDDDDTVPTEANTVAEIKAYLDAQGTEYPSSASKADLLDLV